MAEWLGSRFGAMAALGGLVTLTLVGIAVLRSPVAETNLAGDAGEIQIESRPIIITNKPVAPTTSEPPVIFVLEEMEREGSTEAATITPSPTALPLTTTPVVPNTAMDGPPELPVSSPLAGWPVGGQMTQGFGCTPYYTGITGPDCPDEAPWFHDGVDIAGSAGAPIRAAISGSVIFAGADSSGPACGDWYGYGLTMIVDSGQGWQTLYGHLSRIDVAAGQVLLPDSIIGAIGRTGCASGPHLHFGLNYRGVLVDPALYVLE